MTYRDSSPVFLATRFIQKMPENSDCMYSSIYMLENTWYPNFTWQGPNSLKVVNFTSV